MQYFRILQLFSQCDSVTEGVEYICKKSDELNTLCTESLQMCSECAHHQNMTTYPENTPLDVVCWQEPGAHCWGSRCCQGYPGQCNQGSHLARTTCSVVTPCMLVSMVMENSWEWKFGKLCTATNLSAPIRMNFKLEPLEKILYFGKKLINHKKESVQILYQQ